MKEYLIYHDNKFIGHCSDKDMLDKFITTRNCKYDIVKTKINKIPNTIKETVYFENTQLVYYEGYSVYTDFPLFIYEQQYIENELYYECCAFKQSVGKVLNKLKYLQLKHDEIILIIKSLVEAVRLIEDVSDSNHEIIYDDIFKIDKYMRYLLENNNIKKIAIHKGVT